VTFRFANVGGRSALVDSAGHWFDVLRVSDSVISADPMATWLQLDELHRVSGTIDDAESDGNLSNADVRPPIPSPRSVFAVGLNYQSHADEANVKLPNAPLIYEVPQLPHRSQRPRHSWRRH
jgi:2-keto-4-pentenoate hydratase/2-oxohepta-3-ene-1,7-dioic acid hydratase in catechol pathway